jgi:hypothetical protein
MITSIHQPNFFPWMGFFDKVFKCDSFVFLTSSFRSKDDKFLTRTKILDDSTSKYLSIPLGVKQIPIKDLLMPNGKKWKIKTLNIINNSYHNSKFYEPIVSDVEFLIMNESEYFSDYSINIVNFLLEKLNIDTEIFIDTDFDKDFGVSNERNIAICKEINATTYLSGIGAKAYNNANLFKINNLDLVYQNFSQPIYSQNSNQFIAGLSIMDAIFNCGYEKTEKILKNNES